MVADKGGIGVAIVGIACRYPGADDPSAFWENLRRGVESVERFDESELEDWFDEETRESSDYFRARPILKGVEYFDAGFFGMQPVEAALTDPQHRVFLECSWEALEDAGYDPSQYGGRIGVFAGCSTSTYFLNNVCADRSAVEEYVSQYQVGCYPKLLGALTDFLSTRVAYKLNLRGPAITLHTACSTSLVAVIQACQSLLLYQTDMAIAGGASITFPQRRGYLHQEGGMVSADGHCRPFDEAATGTIFGDGAGAILLKRLDDAIADGDHIYAVIRGCGINNDGAGKVGFTAPSVEAQAASIAMAIADAEIDARSISYVECHGTATPLGDPIELAALTTAFRQSTDNDRFCAIGSIKANIGHTDAAAGVAGLIKTALALKHGQLPPAANFKKPNPHIAFETSPFFVNQTLADWDSQASPRRALVCALGVGGTNAHVVVQEAPKVHQHRDAGQPPHLLLVSARSLGALPEARARLAQAIDRQPESNLSDIAYTLAKGRKHFRHRKAVVCKDRNEAIQQLLAGQDESIEPTLQDGCVAFMFPGQGCQYPQMGLGLYERHPEYRRAFDHCSALLAPYLGREIRDILYGSAGLASSSDIVATSLAQPAIFCLEYSLAQLWMSWGLKPSAMIGHSIGEFAAACLSGVISLEDCLRVVAARGKLLQEFPPGGMLSVRLPEDRLAAYLGDSVSVAAINSDKACVVAGPHDALSSLENRLEAEGIVFRRLSTSHAFHSWMVDAVIEPLRDTLADIQLSPPKIPYVSCVSGTWIETKEALSPDYWARHAREAVRFATGINTLLTSMPNALLEVGPGTTLSLLAAQSKQEKPVIINSLPGENAEEGQDLETILEAYGQLWALGAPLQYPEAFDDGRRIPLPTYPFERRRYFIDPPSRRPAAAAAALTLAQTDVPKTALGEVDYFERNMDMGTVSNKPETVLAEGSAASDQAALHVSLCAIFEELSGEDFAAADQNMSFIELGLDSLFLSQAVQKINKRFKVKVSFRQLLGDLSTMAALQDFLLKNSAEAQSLVTQQTAKTESLPAPATAHLNGSAPLAQRALSTQTPPTPLQGHVEGVMRDQLQAMSQLLNRQLEVLQQLGSGAATSAERAAPQAKVSGITLPSSTAPKSDTVTPAPSRFQVYTPRQKTSDAALTDSQKRHIEGLTERFNKKTARSKELTATYRRVLADPRAVSGFRPEWKDLVYPIVVEKASGSHLWDVDGNEYIDLVNGYGQTAFGHAPDFVTAAVREQLDKGCAIGPQAELAGKIAELFTEITGTERITFCNTGSEAVMAAMRVARCVTGRDKIVVFDGDYHGQFDEVLVRGIKGSNGRSRSVPVAPGIPASAVENLIVLDYGTPEALQWIEKNAGDLAAVMVEPVQSRHPGLQPIEFLRRLREITESAGTAFIMDEVVTGFRAHPAGVQGLTGIKADLATYGKVVGGGLPIGILAGKSKFMDALDGGEWRFGDDSVPETAVTFFAGTFVRHPLVLAAVWAVLNHVKDRGPVLQEAIAGLTAKLVEKLRGLFFEFGIKAKIESFSSFFYFSLANDGSFASLLFYHLRERGIFIQDGFPCFLTSMHGDAEIAQIEWAFREALSDMSSAGLIGAPSESQPVRPTENQVEIWLAAQLSDEASCAFNESVTLRLKGALNGEDLETALNTIVRRHDALRLCFSPSGESMSLKPTLHLELPVLSVPAGKEEADAWLEATIAEDARTPFDLVNGPLIRAKLLQMGQNDHALVLTAHHIICDGWSFNVILEEIAEVYSALLQNKGVSLPDAMQFTAYAEAQETSQVDETYWLQTFESLPPLLDLPTDRPRPSHRSFNGASFCRHVDGDLYARLKSTATRQKCTLFTVLLAGFKTLIGRLAGQSEVTIAIPLGGQSIVDDKLVGHCVNFLPIRSKSSPATTVADYLGVVANAVADANDHQNFTFGTLVRKLNIPRATNRLPLTEIQFNMERLAEDMHFPGMQTTVAPNPKSFVNFDLFFNVIDTGSGLRLDCDYNTDLFDKGTVSRWTDYYVALLETFSRDQKQAVASASYLPETTSHADCGVSGPVMSYPRDKGLHQLFEEQAAKQPAAIAVSFKEKTLSYGELDSRANRLANYLLSKTGGKGERIAVLVDRSAEMVAALLSVWKAGCAFVPVDPSYPEDRIRHILTDASVCAVITDADIPSDVAHEGAPIVHLARDARAIDGMTATNPGRKRGGEDTSHVIYTSGSTGKPKGVAIKHSSVVNLFTSMMREPGFTDNDMVYSVTTIAFDIAGVEIFLPLVCGGKTVIASSEDTKDGYRLLSGLTTSGATFMQATPASWKLLLEAGFRSWPGLTMVCGGEPMLRDFANQLLEGGGTLWNMYGPTETTIYSTAARIFPGEDPITVGWPVANTQLYILDSNDQVVPPGSMGQLHIGGDGLAHGYIGQPLMTEEKFIRNPFGPGRLYRTGDLARRLPSGATQLFGRVDNQIKLRGFRIELGEIEASLVDRCGVAASAVTLREDVPGVRKLVAYWVDKKEAPKTAETLRETLAQFLPDYMVPSAWVKLERLPRLPNGKLDRQTLPAPVETKAENPNSELPRTETEKKLSAIWAEVLKAPNIARTDDLLLLGADSIHVFQITARANKSGLQLAAKDLFKYRTLAALAEFLDGRAAGDSRAGKGLLAGRVPEAVSRNTHKDHSPLFNEPRSAFNPSRRVKQASN